MNDTPDRTDQEKSKLAFGKLYPTMRFLSWQITSVYQIQQAKLADVEKAVQDPNSSNPVVGGSGNDIL